MFLIDTSVFVASLFEQEPFYADAKMFFHTIVKQRIKLFFPISVVCEALHVIYKKSGSIKLRDEVYKDFVYSPFTVLTQESEFLIYFSDHHNKFKKLKASDTVIAMHALRLSVPLVTLDDRLYNTMRQYGAALTPKEALAKLN